ncbi:hypothetical protein A2U01_0108122, partial [Trifolium medium]|nr:hypothetical protein [Trifolium medium]
LGKQLDSKGSLAQRAVIRSKLDKDHGIVRFGRLAKTRL